MSFEEKLKDFCAKIPNKHENIKTEETTKISLILPFIRLMGYDTTDPTIVQAEYTADIGNKKGEKVDFAILKNNKSSYGLKLFTYPFGITPIDGLGKMGTGDFFPYALENGSVYNHGSQLFFLRALGDIISHTAQIIYKRKKSIQIFDNLIKIFHFRNQ